MRTSRIAIERLILARVVHAPLHLVLVARHSTSWQTPFTLVQMAMLVTSCDRWATSGNTLGKWDSISDSRSEPASTQSFQTVLPRRHIVIHVVAQAARLPRAISNEGFNRIHSIAFTRS